MVIALDMLRHGVTPEQLHEQHGIRVTTHNGKASLNYEGTSANGDWVSRQCRGVVAELDTWKLLARPFDRFFNSHEGHAAPIDWDTAEAFEKLDGTLIIAYWHRGRWHAATRNQCDAQGDINGVGTFRELLDRTVDLDTLLRDVPHDVTVMLELVSPYNRIVVCYERPEVYVLGARRLSGEEFELKLDGAKQPFRYPVNSMEQTVGSMSGWTPRENEGVIVRDALFRRIKVKLPAYVQLQRARDSLASGPRGCMEAVRDGNVDKIRDLVPEHVKQRLERYQIGLFDLAYETAVDYDLLKDIPEQKAFALEATQKRWPSALFQLRTGAELRDVVRATRAKTLLDLIGDVDEPVLLRGYE